MRNGTAYLLIANAIKGRDGLIHGKLHEQGEHCAIGSYFETHAHTALPSDIVDEVAAVNDSVPNATPKQRKRTVLKWLRWKLNQLGL